MKLIKTKKVETVTEEIDILPGTYYFEDDDLISYKMILPEEDEDGFCDYILESVRNFGNVFGIIVKDDWLDKDKLPFVFENFILGNGGKKIKQKEYQLERQDVLNKLMK